ncbi:hypothetical protein EJB05_49698, partial [Eragrostis curvula]
LSSEVYLGSGESRGRPEYTAPQQPRGQQATASSSARAYGLVTPAPPINGDAQAPNMYQQTPYRHVQASQSASNNRNVKAIGLSSSYM